jgi:hypothetical protein
VTEEHKQVEQDVVKNENKEMSEPEMYSIYFNLRVIKKLIE